jgi:hypothetical protein
MLTINKEDIELTVEKHDFEISDFKVDGTGRIVITNTGGSSASEGGMGSGSDDDREKGSLSKPGEKSGDGSSNEDTDTTFDPIKKGAKEAEKSRDKE